MGGETEQKTSAWHWVLATPTKATEMCVLFCLSFVWFSSNSCVVSLLAEGLRPRFTGGSLQYQGFPSDFSSSGFKFGGKTKDKWSLFQKSMGIFLFIPGARGIFSYLGREIAVEKCRSHRIVCISYVYLCMHHGRISCFLFEAIYQLLKQWSLLTNKTGFGEIRKKWRMCMSLKITPNSIRRHSQPISLTRIIC